MHAAQARRYPRDTEGAAFLQDRTLLPGNVRMARVLGVAVALLLAAGPLAAQPPHRDEQIGSWELRCPAARRSACTLRLRSWLLPPGGAGPSVAVEVQRRDDALVPVVAVRGLSLHLALGGVTALKPAVSLRFDRGPPIALDCGLDGGAIVCAPQAQGVDAAAKALPRAQSLARAGGFAHSRSGRVAGGGPHTGTRGHTESAGALPRGGSKRRGAAGRAWAGLAGVAGPRAACRGFRARRRRSAVGGIRLVERGGRPLGTRGPAVLNLPIEGAPAASRVMADEGRPPTALLLCTEERRGWPAFAGHDTGGGRRAARPTGRNENC